jgi:hypothetical protein
LNLPLPPLHVQLPWDLAVLSNLQELDLSMNSFQHIPEQWYALSSFLAFPGPEKFVGGDLPLYHSLRLLHPSTCPRSSVWGVWGVVLCHPQTMR